MHSAIYYPDDCSGDAYAFTRALGRRAQEIGANIRTNVDVQKIVVEQSQVAGVQTSNGLFEGANVIVAAGNGAPSLVRPHGIRLPIAPAKGYSITIDMSGWNARPQTSVIDGATHFGAVPLGEKLRCVGIAEFTGVDENVCNQSIDYLFELLERLYPHLAGNIDRRKTKAWAGSASDERRRRSFCWSRQNPWTMDQCRA